MAERILGMILHSGAPTQTMSEYRHIHHQSWKSLLSDFAVTTLITATSKFWEKTFYTNCYI